MSYATVEDRVDRLEAQFGQFLTALAVANKRAEERHRLAEERNRLAEERHQAAEERFGRFQQEMAAFKDEMSVFKAEMRQSKKDLDKKWGDLANKMGTIIEDILAPNLLRLARDYFQFETIEDFMIRRQRRPPGRERATEFDALVVGSKAVILGEAKSNPTVEHADAFAGKMGRFFEFFPEYEGRRLIAVLGSWAVGAEVVERLTGCGIYAMQMGEETMELVNAAAVEGRRRA